MSWLWGAPEPPKPDRDPGQTRQEQILEEMGVFLRENPHIWPLYKKFTFRAIAEGLTRYSSELVCHLIRWHAKSKTTGERVQLNQNYTAYLGRLFMVEFPAHEGLFEVRKCRSKDRPAGEGGVGIDRAPTDDEEARIVRKLREIVEQLRAGNEIGGDDDATHTG